MADESHGEVNSDNQDSAASFSFDRWAETNGLLKNTLKKLQKEDLVSQEAHLLLEPSDISELGLTLGQKRLVSKAVLDLKNIRSNVASSPERAPDVAVTDAPVTPGVAEPLPSTPVTIRDIRNMKQLCEAGNSLDNLFRQLTANVDNHDLQTTRRCASESDAITLCSSDPRTMLTVKSSSKKALHIHNFLSEAARRRLKNKKRDVVLTRDGGDGTLVFRDSTDDTNPYYGISVAEWSAANCRLLNQLLITGDLKRQDIEFYLAYTAAVMDFVNNFEWHNVLDFDFNYREQQACHSFQWGYINPMMKMQYLAPKSSNEKHSKSGKQQQSYRQQKPTEECKQWKANNGVCAFGSRCRYLHVPLMSRQATPVQPPKNGPSQYQTKHLG